VCRNTAEGSDSEVLEVNFDDGIILPRATPAKSGVMHSMSSIPRTLSHSLAWVQFSTPRLMSRYLGAAGCAGFAEAGLPDLREAINHHGFVSNAAIIEVFPAGASVPPATSLRCSSTGRPHIARRRSLKPVIHLLISQMYVQVALTLFCQHLMKGHSVRRCPS
jgi:hypothetical protein